ncbi:MAG: phospholipase/carboxylesterase, partial [Patescibacteria group bacterium]|nr:phospholipase/carboxylesterase [Patescibacteria group bacterium]
MNTLNLFQHVFIDNKAEKTLFLLHGTGGSEHDLLPLVKELSDQYNFVGIKGNIFEHGMARFFERDEFGVFDQDSITTETKKLSEFIEAWKSNRAIANENTAFLGYSNGATMIVALAFYYPELVR